MSGLEIKKYHLELLLFSFFYYSVQSYAECRIKASINVKKLLGKKPDNIIYILKLIDNLLKDYF